MLDLTKPLRKKNTENPAVITAMQDGRFFCEHKCKGVWAWHTLTKEQLEYCYENVPETRTLTGCLNVYSNNFTSSVYEHRKTCDDIAAALPTDDRIACLDLSKYNITFEVGEGL